MPKRTMTVVPATLDPRIKGDDGRILKVAAYCRVSTNKEDQRSSYESQVEYYTSIINGNPNWQFAGIFADEGIGGLHIWFRDQFIKMIRECEQGKIDLILTKSVSRFSRNTVDCLMNVRKLKKLGVAVLFESEGINTLENDDETLLTIFSTTAQAESVSLSKNVRMGLRQGYKAGKVPYHNIFGYRKGENGNFVIMPEEAEVVRRVYDCYLVGQSIGQIRKGLETDGILSPKGKTEWSEYVIRQMLLNEKYCGDVLLQKTFTDDVLTGKSKKNTGQLPKYYVQNNHPPIVSRDIFKQVQEELASRARKEKTPSPATKPQVSEYRGKYCLNKILVCGECGSPYRRTTWAKPPQGRVGVWRCINRLEHGTKNCKQSVSPYEQELHEVIRTVINQAVSQELLLEAVMDSAKDAGLPELRSELAEMFKNNPPELKEYDDRYTWLLIKEIKVQGKTLNIVFKDGTEVEREIG